MQVRSMHGAAGRLVPLALAALALGCERPTEPSEPIGKVLAQAQPGQSAEARLSPTAGNDARGRVEFRPADSGGLEIVARVEGIPPGTYGIHIHEVGDCSASDASSAGDHFSPSDDPHGGPYDPRHERHAGDLGNITVDASGAGRKELTVDELALDGEYGIVGKAVIVHDGEDDLTSQPSGDSGDPVACGVIEASAKRGAA